MSDEESISQSAENEQREQELEQRFQKIRHSYKNKQRVLILSSRGITHRYRHLMNDIAGLLPHCKKDVKLDTKDNLGVLNELAELKNCNSCLFFEVRKKQDLFLWMSKTPQGPSIKFHVLNVHTMDELKFTGNCLKGSRPFLSFDAQFDSTPHHRLMKETLKQIFGTPKGHPKSKPFIDHVFSFYILDNKIWFRNFQLSEEKIEGQKKPERVLVEIGPRFVLSPVKILSGGFQGVPIYENEHYVSPNALRTIIRQKALRRFEKKQQANEMRKMKDEENQVMPVDEYEDVFA